MKWNLIIVLFFFLLTGCQSKEYTVSFNTLGGTTLNSVKIPHGGTIENVEPPKKDGYIFVSWEKDGVIYNEKTPINEDLTLTANWILAPDLSKEYRVVFDINGELSETVVKGKNLLAKPKDPTIKYYSFAGWYDGTTLYNFDSPVTKDLYLVAKFEKKFLTVSFDLDGGSGISKTKVEAGTTIEKPKTPTKLGYNFVGWYYLGKVYNFNSIIENDLTLTAKWKAIEYVTVKYQTNGGTLIKSETIIKGESAPIPSDPIKEGYRFEYWQYNGVEYDFKKPVEETIELIAIYNEDSLGE